MIETDWCLKKPSIFSNFQDFHRIFMNEVLSYPQIFQFWGGILLPVAPWLRLSHSQFPIANFNPGICVETALEKLERCNRCRCWMVCFVFGRKHGLWSEGIQVFMIQSLQTSMSSLRPRKSHVEALSDFRFESSTWDTALKTLLIRICEVNVGWNDSRFGHLESEKS